MKTDGVKVDQLVAPTMVATILTLSLNPTQTLALLMSKRILLVLARAPALMSAVVRGSARSSDGAMARLIVPMMTIPVMTIPMRDSII